LGRREYVDDFLTALTALTATRPPTRLSAFAAEVGESISRATPSCTTPSPSACPGCSPSAGAGPPARLHGVAIRHRDGSWFGADRLWGDVFPHCWSA